jgi:hypothetical protein
VRKTIMWPYSVMQRAVESLLGIENGKLGNSRLVIHCQNPDGIKTKGNIRQFVLFSLNRVEHILLAWQFDDASAVNKAVYYPANEQLQTRNTVTGNLEPADKKDRGPVSSDKE